MFNDEKGFVVIGLGSNKTTLGLLCFNSVQIYIIA